MWGEGPFSMAPAAPRDSDSCKRLSIYLLNRCFSLIILLSSPFLNLHCLTLNYIWDAGEKNSFRDL